VSGNGIPGANRRPHRKDGLLVAAPRSDPLTGRSLQLALAEREHVGRDLCHRLGLVEHRVQQCIRRLDAIDQPDRLSLRRVEQRCGEH
jgi:hypothetical protein